MNLLAHITAKHASAMSDAELDAAISAIQRYRPLFAELPKGTSLWDAALCKFHRNDPLAVEFMQSHWVAA